MEDRGRALWENRPLIYSSPKASDFDLKQIVR
jgi:hypothetical protein